MNNQTPIYYPALMRACEIPTLGQLLRTERTASTVTPVDYSEESLHYATQYNRQLEVTPPRVPDWPTGCWAISTQNPEVPNIGFLYQLLDVPLDQLEPRERDQNQWLIEKYCTWYAQGHQPPPLLANAGTDGLYHISDGHHRYGMLKAFGMPRARVLVNLNNNAGGPLTHHNAVQTALLTTGQDVPLIVLQDYPDLLELALSIRAHR